ncbi:HypC/HybG/HupF family hydrogenase formation chaperone [Ktedonobacteria bacterium brp13]|nr:HypC/HybG/HupF family hydrogenase formation chaperone [Ktedonobacteria bacterium brp13]
MKDAEQRDALDLFPVHKDCAPTADGYCITCSDAALVATVLRVEQESSVALVSVQGLTEEIDITLVDTVVAGDQVLVHGGVAVALFTESESESEATHEY